MIPCLITLNTPIFRTALLPSSTIGSQTGAPRRAALVAGRVVAAPAAARRSVRDAHTPPRHVGQRVYVAREIGAVQCFVALTRTDLRLNSWGEHTL
jgi:hypothetical protein